jgi:hypothetical protein
MEIELRSSIPLMLKEGEAFVPAMEPVRWFYPTALSVKN